MRPIVVFMQEDKREALRKGGGLPDEWITAFDDNGFLTTSAEGRPAILFWPHKISYKTGPDAVNTDKPFDVAAYLGATAAEEGEEKRRHEREVYSAFCNTVAVHIVFLEPEKKGDVSKYLQLHSFGELAEWGRSFKMALDQRFPKRTNAKHILVVVVSGEQIKTSREEILNFKSMLNDSGFSRFYLLDHDLGRGKSGKNFHATDVWSIMLERLLLFFVLAEESGADLDANCKAKSLVWQAFECRIPSISVHSQTGLDDKDRAWLVDEMLKDSHANMLNFPGMPKFPEHPYRNANESFEYEKLNFLRGWSAYPVEKLFAICKERQKVDSEGWREIRPIVIKISNLVSQCRQTLSSWLRLQVHQNPAVKTYIGNMQDVMNDEGNNATSRFAVKDAKPDSTDSGNKTQSISETVDKILENEYKCQNALKSLRLRDEYLKPRISSRCGNETLAESVYRAQSHYVGLFKGVFCMGAMSAMFGWVIWRATMVLGCTPIFTMLLSGAFAFGMFAMLLTMLGFQRRAGDKAVNKLREKAHEANLAFREKDLYARRLKFYARTRHCNLARVGMLANLKRQLDGVCKVLERELKTTQADPREAENVDAEGENGLMRDFEKMTVKTFNDVRLSEEPADVETQRSSFKNRLIDKWKQLCKSADVVIDGAPYSFGYFPAAYFYQEIHTFVIEQQKERKRKALYRAVARSKSNPTSRGNALEELKEWCYLRHTECNSEFASGDVRDLVNCPQTLHHFYIPIDPGSKSSTEHNDAWKIAVEEKLSETKDNVYENADVKTSRIIDETRTFALFYRQLEVELDCQDIGVLLLRRKDEEVQ